MPLLRFDLIEGRGDAEIQELLDVTCDVLVGTLHGTNCTSAKPCLR
jgi:hypothetical protein